MLTVAVLPEGKSPMKIVRIRSCVCAPAPEFSLSSGFRTVATISHKTAKDSLYDYRRFPRSPNLFDFRKWFTAIFFFIYFAVPKHDSFFHRVCRTDPGSGCPDRGFIVFKIFFFCIHFLYTESRRLGIFNLIVSILSYFIKLNCVALPVVLKAKRVRNRASIKPVLYSLTNDTASRMWDNT